MKAALVPRAPLAAVAFLLLCRAMPLHAESIAMTRSGGTYGVPVTINGRLTLTFTVDSGAAVVTIPDDVARTLWRAGALARNDLIGRQTYALADGTQMHSVLFRIRSLQVGAIVVHDVMAAIGPQEGALLLGQSFLKKFRSWSIDNDRHELIVNVGGDSSVTVIPGGLNATSPESLPARPPVTLDQVKAADDCSAQVSNSGSAVRVRHIFGIGVGGHAPKELGSRYGSKTDTDAVTQFVLGQEQCFAPVEDSGLREGDDLKAMRETYMLFVAGLRTYGETADALRGQTEKLARQLAAAPPGQR